MGRTLVYPKDQKNTIHRHNHQVGVPLPLAERYPWALGTYDLHDIHSIVNATAVLHVSFNLSDPEDPFPTILPMIGVMGSYDHPSADLDEPLDCYLHGYVSSGLMKAARTNAEKGLPITIAATKVDGVVLSLTPNSHSYNYRSAVLFGYGKLVEDPEEKVWAMEKITNAVLPGRWDHTRIPPDGAEMVSTNILKVKIVKGSGKVRTGGPNDDKKDVERADVVSKVWTGVVPVWETAGEPVAGGQGRVKEIPEHVLSFWKETSADKEEYAKGAAVSAS